MTTLSPHKLAQIEAITREKVPAPGGGVRLLLRRFSDAIERPEGQQFYEQDEDRLNVNLHQGQTRAFDIIQNEWDRVRVLLILAGWQSGKTLTGAPYLHYCMQRRTAEGRKGTTTEPLDFVAASATYDVLRLKMLPALRGLFEQWLGWGRYSASDRIIYSNDGLTRIILRSADSGVGLESFTAVDGWADEWGRDEVDITAFESMMRGLAVNQGHLLITTTAWNLGWLKQQVYDRWLGGDTNCEVVSFSSLENPAFPRAEWDRAKATFPVWKFAMRYEGKFTRPAGLIYGDYNDSYAALTPVYAKDDDRREWPIRYEKQFTLPDQPGHLVKPFKIPPTWLRRLGVDFGPVNEGRLWLAEEPGTGCYYLYREKLGGGLSGPEYAREVLEYKEPIRHAAGGSKSEEEKRKEWQYAGLGISEPLIFEVEAGIDHVIGLLRQHRLFVFDTLTITRSQLATYSRELDDAGEPLEKIANKDKFHMLDALRYVASTIPIERPKKPAESLELPIGRTRAVIRKRQAAWDRGTRKRGVEEY